MANSAKASLSHSAVYREIKILKKMSHKNIIRLHGFCLPINPDFSSKMCLIYEIAEKGALNRILEDNSKARKLPCQDRLKIIIGVAEGLDYLHNNNPEFPVYHGDIKAANIAIMADYTPKILDFGMSKFKSLEASTGDFFPIVNLVKL
jgi:serine/threonine protein kinase